MQPSSKDKAIKQKIRQLLRTLILILYLTFIILDNWHLFAATNWLKWFSILLIAVVQTTYSQTPKTWLMAVWLTLVCDFFLLFNVDILLAIALFCLVHGLRLFTISSYQLKKALPLLGLILIFSILNQSLTVGVLLCYALLLVGNAYTAEKIKEKKLWLAYLLFIACDICVVILNVSFSGSMAETAALASWVFYLPSQLCLVKDFK